MRNKVNTSPGADAAAVRNAVPDDAEIVSAFVCRCYDDFAETDGWSPAVVAEVKKTRGSVECIRDLMREETVFVADEGAGPVGMVGVRGNVVTKLFVDPDCHRRGIGTRLFRRAESFIREQGFPSLFLGAAVETALPFYEKMGMSVVGWRTIDCGLCRGMASTILEKRLA